MRPANDRLLTRSFPREDVPLQGEVGEEAEAAELEAVRSRAPDHGTRVEDHRVVVGQEQDQAPVTFSGHVGSFSNQKSKASSLSGVRSPSAGWSVVMS
jgi:hypothetical protein